MKFPMTDRESPALSYAAFALRHPIVSDAPGRFAWQPPHFDFATFEAALAARRAAWKETQQGENHERE